VAVGGARVRPVAGRFHFHEADRHVPQRDGVIRPGLEGGERRFADGNEQPAREAAEFREIGKECFQRGAELILRLAGGGRIR
jgi:hypothetical protein